MSFFKKIRLSTPGPVLVLDAPESYIHLLETEQMEFGKSLKKYIHIHWFVLNKRDFDASLKKVIALLQEGIYLWIFYPKGTSGIQTDLTRDKGWEAILLHEELKWINLVSLDETWSAFGVRLKTSSEAKVKGKEKKNTGTEKYIDPVKKVVIVPEDLQKAFKKNKDAALYYESLSYSHRREYVEWIVTAKREETRMKRVEGAIERLMKKWKNPSNH